MLELPRLADNARNLNPLAKIDPSFFFFFFFPASKATGFVAIYTLVKLQLSSAHARGSACMCMCGGGWAGWGSGRT